MKKIENGKVKLTPEIKQEIINSCLSQPEQKKQLAEKYGVTLRSIQILCKKNNEEVKAEEKTTSVAIDIDEKKLGASYLIRSLDYHLKFMERWYPDIFEMQDLSEIAILKSSVYDYIAWLGKQVVVVKNVETPEMKSYFLTHVTF